MEFSLEKPFHFDGIYALEKKSTIFYDGYEHEFVMSYIAWTYTVSIKIVNFVII